MINIAFTTAQSKDWMGGVNYHKNLFFAISKLEKRQIAPVVFLGKETDTEIIELLRPYAQIVVDSLFDRQNVKFTVANALAHYLNWPILQNRLFKKHNIDVVHTLYGPTKGLSCKTISWIPDFQHIHLPSLFSENLISQRNKAINSLLEISDATILSSHDAYNDCLTFGTGIPSKLHVLQFVCQPNPEVFNLEKDDIKERHSVPEKYFYLPNQLWKHKNHLQVFNAIKNLKTTGLEINLVCSGSMNDYRNPHYIEEVKSFIATNKLENNIKLLGFINYLDVLYFIRYSVSVINPSLFEGWSSTVEECKSIGKSMILSDLNVHREQNPADSYFFERDNPAMLEDCLRNAWLANKDVPEKELESEAAKLLPIRTKEFAEKFQSIVMEVMEV